MEKKLRKLFDYQRFEPSGKLAALISESEGRYAKALTDDELEEVNAAGVPEQMIDMDREKNKPPRIP